MVYEQQVLKEIFIALLLGKQKLFNNPTNVLKPLPFPTMVVKQHKWIDMNANESSKDSSKNLFVVPQIFIW